MLRLVLMMCSFWSLCAALYSSSPQKVPNIDFGLDDNQREPGFLQGFTRKGLGSLPESDRFLEWLNKYMEDGVADDVEDVSRIKPFYVSSLPSPLLADC